jgi:hypothetical protein
MMAWAPPSFHVPIIEGDVFRMIIKVPEFGTDISAKQANGQGESPIAGEVTGEVLQIINPSFAIRGLNRLFSRG